MRQGTRRVIRMAALVCSAVLVFEMGVAGGSVKTWKSAEMAETVVEEAAEEIEKAPVLLLTEDVKKREENVKYFIRTDGNREAAVYQQAVHYQENGGMERD